MKRSTVPARVRALLRAAEREGTGGGALVIDGDEWVRTRRGWALRTPSKDRDSSITFQQLELQKEED